jgi:phosphomevalonate kinase
MIEKMMLQADTPNSKVPFEDKLKLIDRWMKFQQLARNLKAGGLGSGFDVASEEDEEDEPGES